MQITETSADGLRREFKVTVPADEIETRVANRLSEIGKTIKIPGFRPGKVPMALLKQRYGQSVMGEVLEQAVNDGSAKAVEEHKLRPALQPKVEVTKFEAGSDLEFSMAVELLPDFEPADMAAIAVEKPVVEVADAMVDDGLKRIAANRKTSAPLEAERPAQSGDIVVIDFDGSVDGEKRPGMKGEDHELELGSGSFIPGFEDQLVGAAKGEHRTVTVTFPENYHAAELSGKEAVFEVDVKDIRVPKAAEIDEDFAKSFGFDDLAGMRDAIRERMQADYASMSRMRAKRQLLDRLAETHDFPVPTGMVDIEFDQIWRRLQQELKDGEADPEDKEKDEEGLKAEYRAIAERRVRLGLLLSEVGRRNNITVTRDELGQAVVAEAQRYPGQERQVFDFFRNNPQAVEGLRAPIFEDKVVDFILGQVKLTERTVSVEDLMRDPEEDEGPTAAA
ncbi:trigger factor [Rhodospirillum centenum]|uniref:Trigger factor n=1 Tax=Rhodospirillum centenum (strain ATCC 51521 / SW) TaxID=414684 RepID=TIG_RHOCS|nr:trigger factor [Rhodospirillum centenum]B6ISY8.1 RecName: Full=Trigger factor; Short=TF; AltName: Full=PPIase [Rhodospirillum centenum SW]ACI98659.1 trigger factor TF, putative [Rhodospirillum centenum SW]